MNLIILLSILLIIELIFSPRIEYTRTKDILLFYNSKSTRKFIKLF